MPSSPNSSRHRLSHRRRTAPEPRRLSGRTAGESAAGIDGLSPHTRTGRPEAHQPVVDVDPRRLLEPPAGAPLVAKAATTILSSTSHSTTLRRTRIGPAGTAHRSRMGGRGPRRPATARPTPGATNPKRPAQRLANYWHGEFPYLPDTGYGQTAPVGSFPPTATGFSTWRATCGSGPPTGTATPAPTDPCCAADSLRPGSAAVPHPPQGHQGRLVPVRRQLLPALPPAARRPQMVDTGMSHIGFRCISRDHA